MFCLCNVNETKYEFSVQTQTLSCIFNSMSSTDLYLSRPNSEQIFVTHQAAGAERAEQRITRLFTALMDMT